MLRLIVLLLALLAVGLLVHQQLGPVAVTPDAQLKPGDAAQGAPGVPRRADQLPAFETQMQQYLDSTTDERRRTMEEMSQ